MEKKVVLITGASSGIGKETAKMLLSEGHIVYGAARRVNKMDDLIKLGGKIFKLDITKEEDIQNFVKEVLKKKEELMFYSIMLALDFTVVLKIPLLRMQNISLRLTYLG